ncbi:MAG: hypothetical protein ACOZQL_13910 [Myxococcota bacterium]
MRRGLTAIMLLGALGCVGGEPCPFERDAPRRPRPQVCTDRASLGFAPENASSGTPLGTTRTQHLVVSNGGLEPLLIGRLNVEGPLAFTLGEELPTTLASAQTASVRVQFAPTATGPQTGALVIESNAENAPRLEVRLWGCGIAADAGTTACQP